MSRLKEELDGKDTRLRQAEQEVTCHVSGSSLMRGVPLARRDWRVRPSTASTHLCGGSRHLEPHGTPTLRKCLVQSPRPSDSAVRNTSYFGEGIAAGCCWRLVEAHRAVRVFSCLLQMKTLPRPSCFEPPSRAPLL